MVYFGFAIASSSNCNMQGYEPHNANHIKNMLNTEGIRRKRDLEQVENNKIRKEKNMHTELNFYGEKINVFGLKFHVFVKIINLCSTV